MSDETTLLPCPFCGGEARLVNDYSIEKGMRYQIWHECTGHEGRSGGYGQGVKPFFETPWYPTDAEAIAAWNTRAHGTLTAEQVRKAVEGHGNIMDNRLYEDWQAVADELNAELGSGTCEVSYEQDGIPRCSECQNVLYDEYKDSIKNYCDECGRKAVER